MFGGVGGDNNVDIEEREGIFEGAISVSLTETVSVIGRLG